MDFPDVALAGGDVELTCDWGSNAEEKQVYWYRLLEIPSIDAEILLAFSVDVNGVTNVAVANPSKFEHVEQERYDMQHKLLLKDVQEEDEGLYLCAVIVAGVTFKSINSKELSVRSKLKDSM